MTTKTECSISTKQVEQFHQDGFLVVENLIDPALVEGLVDRFDPLFSGEFETGVYPDEWHWNPYLGKPGAAGQMTGIWKCDRTLAAVITSAKVGAIAAELEGWSGARLLSDGIWQKPHGAKETTLHQDSMYINYHTPTQLVVCWVALSNAVVGAGTIEYVRGSHRWELSEAVPEFHNQNKSYRSEMGAGCSVSWCRTAGSGAAQCTAGGWGFSPRAHLARFRQKHHGCGASQYGVGLCPG